MQLHDTKWLAKRLNLSVSTIEKLRAQNSQELPKPIQINKTIRYSDSYVEWWLETKQNMTALEFRSWLNARDDKPNPSLNQQYQSDTKGNPNDHINE